MSVEARPHEYANETQDKISMFLIDFDAHIKIRSILLDQEK